MLFRFLRGRLAPRYRGSDRFAQNGPLSSALTTQKSNKPASNGTRPMTAILQRMLQSDRDCTELAQQISLARAALDRVAVDLNVRGRSLGDNQARSGFLSA